MVENVEKMRDVTERSATSLTASLKSIKGVCSNYFQHYELDLEELRLRTASLENKYKDWSKVLIEPQTMNDARVFALEARMEKEEDTRIKEFEFMRDLTRKLVYSLEQLSLQHLDRQETAIAGDSTLPSLMNSAQNRTPDIG